YVKYVIKIVEEKFNETLDQGVDILNSYIAELKENNEKVLSGVKSFKLYDTYGFPMDLTQEILEEQGFGIDEDGFQEEMEAQRQRARADRGAMEDEGWKEDALSTLDESIASTFDGYKNLNVCGNVTAIVKGDEVVNTI
ncbi:alanine--tRNA ligase, partial [Clostridium perfringens]